MNRNRKIGVCLLLVLTAAVQIFIFSNSMKDGEASTAQSDKVVELVRPAAEKVLPLVHVEPDDSILSNFVRNLGHFSEFALLGCVSFAAVWMLTKRRPLRFAVPFAFCVLTACADETIQLFSPGRAWQISDLLTDSAGALCGMLFAFLLCLLLAGIRRRNCA